MPSNFCKECGKEIGKEDAFCSGCGAANKSATTPVIESVAGDAYDANIAPSTPAVIRKKYAIAFALGAFALIGLLAYFLHSQHGFDKAVADAPKKQEQQAEKAQILNQETTDAALSSHSESNSAIQSEQAAKTYARVYYGPAIDVGGMKRDYSDNAISADKKYGGSENPSSLVKFTGYVVKVVRAEPAELHMANIIFNQAFINLPFERYELLPHEVIDSQLLILREFDADQVVDLHNGSPITAICSIHGVDKKYESAIDFLALGMCQDIKFAPKPDPKYAPIPAPIATGESAPTATQESSRTPGNNTIPRTGDDMVREMENAATTSVATLNSSGINGLIKKIDECYSTPKSSNDQNFKCIYLDIAGRFFDRGAVKALKAPPKSFFQDEQMDSRVDPVFKKANIGMNEEIAYLKNVMVVMDKMISTTALPAGISVIQASRQTSEAEVAKTAPSDSAPAAGTTASENVISGHWIVHADTAYDRRTNLTWQRCSLGQTLKTGRCAGTTMQYRFDEAKAHVYGPWRLPTKDELASLIDGDRKARGQTPVLDADVFSSVDIGHLWYWSSTQNDSDATLAWGVHFASGFVGGTGIRSGQGSVRLVRDGQ